MTGGAGAIIGAGSCFGQNASFTSYAYVKGDDNYIGGLFGNLYTADLNGCVLTNYGNVEGNDHVGGIIGDTMYPYLDDCILENTGNVYGKSKVGVSLGVPVRSITYV